MKNLFRVLLAVAGIAGLAQAQQITGAGATFPAPVYQKWFDEYRKMHPDAQVNYQSIGSGAGIQQLTSGTVDFGASDVPMTDEQISKLKTKALHFPTVMGAVVPIYNLSGVTQDLKFSPEVLAGIFLGTINKWSDKKLAADNPGVKFPNDDIVVVHRSDGSGTSFVWTDFLSKVSPEWKSKVGAAAAVSWPVGLGGKGSEGVSGTVKQTPGSIGYVEMTFAIQNKIAFGSVKNSAGTFVKGDPMSVTEAAAGAAKSMPPDFRVSITNAPGKGSYPISTFTWLLIPKQFADANKGKTMKAFLQWMLTDGQKMAPALDYAPLPKEVVAMEVKQIAQVQ
jgi:phosphate transport system substrate-binding protein